MTTERELLELAALACGYTLEDHYDANGEYWPWCHELRMLWRPGRDSADGAELEAALGLDVQWFKKAVQVTRYSPLATALEYYAKHGGNKQNARMWATLRAAAEVGRRKG